MCRESKKKRKTKRAKQPETSQELYYQNKIDKDKETGENFEKDMRKYINEIITGKAEQIPNKKPRCFTASNTIKFESSKSVFEPHMI